MQPEELRRLLKKVAIIGAFFVLSVVLYLLKLRGVLVGYLVTVAVFSVLAILLQSGRGGGLASSLGGLGADSLLGARAATPIAKATYVMLGLFFFNLMLLARLGGGPGETSSLMPMAPETGALPATPAPAPEPAPETTPAAEQQAAPADVPAPPAETPTESVD